MPLGPEGRPLKLRDLIRVLGQQQPPVSCFLDGPAQWFSASAPWDLVRNAVSGPPRT